MKKGIVNYIYDGDTIRIKNEKGFEKLRLAFIDTQEIGQPFYLRAKQRLLQLLPINSQIEYKEISLDKYRRTLVEIYKDNQFINEIMVAEGLAILYPFMFNPYYSKMILKQLMAKQNKQGIWSDPNPVMPWDFRTVNNKKSN